MKRADISDLQVVVCAVRWREGSGAGFVTDLLAELTGAPYKVAEAAMERAVRRGLLDYGVSLRTAWPTEAGLALLTSGQP
jgi:hypothetical protein